jgi:hypothetical protein
MRRLIVFAIFMAVQAACGDTPSGPGGTTTTGTTTTTTTGTPTFAADFTVTNTPCVAPAAGNVSCTFNGAATGGTPPYTYTSWKFTNPANGQVVPPAGSGPTSGPTQTPALGCGFSTGVVQFNITVDVTAQDSAARTNQTTRTQSITRAAGACGT